MSLFSLVRQDIRYHANHSANNYPLPRVLQQYKLFKYTYRLLLGFLAPAFWGTLFYRLAHASYKKRLLFLPMFFQGLAMIISGAEISAQAEIGPGIKLAHSYGIVIGKRCKIGRNVSILSNVTLGDRGTKRGHPVVEDECYIGTGAKVLGDITIGRGAVIGANAVVLTDIPPYGIAVGIPAKVIGYTDDNEPASQSPD